MKLSFMTAALAVCLFNAPVLAFTHLTGEDALFLGKDGRQIESWVDYSQSKEGGDRYSTGASAELTYGLWDKLDLLVTVPWHGWNSRGLSESGLGDALLEAKFQAAEWSGWTLAVKPGFSLPAGNEARSLVAGRGGVWLYGAAGKTAGPWQFGLNAGYKLNRNSLGEEKNVFRASAAALLKLQSKLRAAAALAAATNTDRNSSSHPASALFGLVWSPLGTLDLDAGLRLGLNKAADDIGLLAGFTIRL